MEKNPLTKDIEKWVRQNGGVKIVTDILISENHDIYEAEAVRADARLRKAGIRSYADIQSRIDIVMSDDLDIVKDLYEQGLSPNRIRSITKIRVSRVWGLIRRLIRTGEIESRAIVSEIWDENDIQFLKWNAHRMNNGKLSAILGRTEQAIATRKKLLGLRMEEKHKAPRGILSNNYYKD
jgi:hypothetical protein